LRLREELEKGEERGLAPWASRATRGGARLHAEPEHPYRTAFQRDRDRIVHAAAFRRLQYKTQVFVYHEGDHFRSRLTHTLEVAQIARTVARALGCNEDLTEAIALAHDLGHTPFGHSGERALHRLLAAHGGFEHNRQTLRVVDLLERRTARYPGLNLTDATRAGLLKHGADFPRYAHPVPLPPLGASPSVEAQIADACDEIAYHNHDVDDGLRSGLLEIDALLEVPLWREAWERAGTEGEADERVRRARAIARLIDALATDLVRTSHAKLEAEGVASSDEVRALPERAVDFSPAMTEEARRLGRFLRERLYEHPRVRGLAERAERVLGDLWRAYAEDRARIPEGALRPAPGEPAERAIADYIAGMTDRFALDERAKLTGRDGRA
jgi:dGTPase